MKTIIAIITTILLLSCISASTINITAGESYFLKIDVEYSYWKVIGNLTNVNVTRNETGVIIIPDKYTKEGSFNITFYNWKDEVVKSTGQQGGGGSSYSKPKVNDTIEINETIEEPEEIEEIIEGNQGEEVSKDKYKIAKIVVLVIALIILIGILYIKFSRKADI